MIKKIEEKYNRKYPFLYIQWHITALCHYRCKHCYLPADETYRSEIEYELDLKTCKSLIDEIFNLAEKENTQLLDICLTGGDPLLRKDLFKIIDYIQVKEKKSHIKIALSLMSTPKSIKKKNLIELKKRNIKNIQLSIDGREDIHDSIRGKGAFKDLLEALTVLRQEGFPLLLMFTLSRENKDELIPLMDWAGEKAIDSFAFSRVVPIGDAVKNYSKEDFFSPEEYREFLIQVLTCQYENALKDRKTFFPLKESLWQLLYKEHNRWDENKVTGCCYIGGMLTVLADGTLLPCRRLPIKLGTFPDVSLMDIFYNSPLLNKLKDLSNYEKCSECKIVKTCRGNPCISYAVTENPFSPDPQCWRQEKNNRA